MALKKIGRFLLFVVLAVLFTWYGYFDKQPCSIDNETFYCLMHPFRLGDKIGTILIYISCIYLSGFWSIASEGLRPKYDHSWPDWLGWLIGVAGLISIVVF